MVELFSAKDAEWLARIEDEPARRWTAALIEGAVDDWDSRAELASALVILATRVAGAGLDARLSERMPSLEEWNSPFIELSRTVDRFAECYQRSDPVEELCPNTLAVLDRCIEQVVRFRAEKAELGTTLYLSSSSLRMLQQLQRLRLLVQCTSESDRVGAVTTLALQLTRECARKRPALHFALQKLELIAYLIVGHAAQKAEKYAVWRTSEYLGFWYKSVLGGLLVAIFASLKIHLSHEGLAPLPQALLHGANYAICFALIYLFGGTLATKQPSLTATRLAESLGGGVGCEPFPLLVRAIWRSQFVSFLGNIAGAGAFAALLAVGFAAHTGQPLVSHGEALKLAGKMHLFQSGTLFYAGVAGVMLSVAGILGGFIDNFVVFHRLPERVRHGRGLFRWFGPRTRDWLAGRVGKSSGAMGSNVLLGFMLGSAGALGVILGIPFDIRHIAFASSHGVLALISAPELLSFFGVSMIALAVGSIGLVNFLVSFLLTLGVAVHARDLEGIDWGARFADVWQLVKREPLSFFLPIGDDPPRE